VFIEFDEPTNGIALRQASVSTVLDALQKQPRCSRAELAQLTGLSKPTVATALAALEGGGLVRERGRTTGRRGPSASLYEFVADAALVLGIDVGAHQVRAVLADLDGKPQADAEAALEVADAEQLLRVIGELAGQLRRATTELVIVGSPGIVDPGSGRIRSCPQIDGWEGIEAERVLSDLLGIRTTVENDVNLAALGELARGAGQGRASFAYLNVGSGLGAGLVIDGRLYRGRHGAAGEVGYLAVGADPAANTTSSQGAMERRLSHEALVSFARSLDPGAPRDPRELFARARRGDRLGRAVVAEATEALSVCIASINAVVDLDLVLVGGGIGLQSDVLIEPLRASTAALVPYPPEILPGALGDQATLSGAAAIGAQLARRQLVNRSL
jgi:predicted NBD/HSP70 family sugar kinase